LPPLPISIRRRKVIATEQDFQQATCPTNEEIMELFPIISDAIMGFFYVHNTTPCPEDMRWLNDVERL
jgi:hypothetical protein